MIFTQITNDDDIFIHTDNNKTKQNVTDIRIECDYVSFCVVKQFTHTAE